jgi:putative phosphoesterase
MFISDIHGVPGSLQKALEFADRLQVKRIVILGDVLYHGPRNGVPGFYDPAKVAELLNERKEQIIAVRGNCDAEVDQMMLKFPIMADYSELFCDERCFFLTHGHLWNENNMPPVPEGTVLVHGHTHIPEYRMIGDTGVVLFNPGSISLPKQQTPRSFGFFDGKDLTLRAL